MIKTRKNPSVKGCMIQKELAAVDRLFRKMKKDKSLPSFGQHFIHCLLFGIAENVNLKKLYPKPYRQLNAWVGKHNRKILKMKTGRKKHLHIT